MTVSGHLDAAAGGASQPRGASAVLLGVLPQVSEYPLTGRDMGAVCAAVVSGVGLYLGDEVVFIVGSDRFSAPLASHDDGHWLPFVDTYWVLAHARRLRQVVAAVTLTAYASRRGATTAILTRTATLMDEAGLSSRGITDQLDEVIVGTARLGTETAKRVDSLTPEPCFRGMTIDDLALLDVAYTSPLGSPSRWRGRPGYAITATRTPTGDAACRHRTGDGHENQRYRHRDDAPRLMG